MNEHQQLTSSGDLTKVVIPLESSDWHKHATESVWAEPVGPDLFRIDNVPFYADGLSYADIVAAEDRDGERVMSRVARRGGHSTYRFFLTESSTPDDWRAYWAQLEGIGCSFERATRNLFAIDVPPEVDIWIAYQMLEAGERAGVWSFQEGHCEHTI